MSSGSSAGFTAGDGGTPEDAAVADNAIGATCSATGILEEGRGIVGAGAIAAGDCGSASAGGCGVVAGVGCGAGDGVVDDGWRTGDSGGCSESSSSMRPCA